jgi:hypothetical protein
VASAYPWDPMPPASHPVAARSSGIRRDVGLVKWAVALSGVQFKAQVVL